MDIGNVKRVSNLADVEIPQSRKVEQVVPVAAEVVETADAVAV
tara:strand:+ start:91 stop:219 length:129 start_codon:yes stop_codon:yes gene_type:complete